MKKFIYVITFLAVISPVVLPAMSDPAAAAPNAEIDINVNPEEYLFNITNMKPGDWAPRTIQVQNEGTKAFKYVATVQNNGGSEKLFDELWLEVKGADSDLYDGKLAKFDGFLPRNLSPSSEEDLTFFIRFPEHLGNEFQGLETNFILTFQAEGNVDHDQAASAGKVGDGGSPLPNTATDMFTCMLIGIAFVVTGGIVYFLYRIRQNNRKSLAGPDIQ
ncbi:TasA family protein [Lentibacillus salicampi]|nr:TasA family protein [Lentibacillus salicampi]